MNSAVDLGGVFSFLIEASLNVLFQIIITFYVNVLCQIYTKSLQSQMFSSSASRYAFFFLLSKLILKSYIFYTAVKYISFVSQLYN